MADINVLLQNVPGLGLPSTLCLSRPRSLPVFELCRYVHDLFPASHSDSLYLTHTCGQQLKYVEKDQRLSDLLQDEKDDFLLVRLNARLPGGKGGFGSQLRAAGGRMSSRKRKQQAEKATASARNLDGRRLRTITEAKNLATYLASKPDSDRREREEKLKKWQSVVDAAEQKEADMRAGRTADGRRKGLTSQWLEEKEEINENIKNAVKMAMSNSKQEVSSNASSEDLSDEADGSDIEDPMELDHDDMNRLRTEAEAGDEDARWVLQNRLKIPSEYLPKQKISARKLVGFDDDLDEEDSSESLEEVSHKNQSRTRL